MELCFNAVFGTKGEKLESEMKEKKTQFGFKRAKNRSDRWTDKIETRKPT